MLGRSLIIALLLLYLLRLGSVGFLGPDEPRYASVARAMASSGDWITPRLDGQPWFEKPPLLYWMTASARLLHLPDEWAARLPVALASVAFLMFFFQTVKREFSERTAIAATAILSTSAGWLAYSFAALTDLPMTVTLVAALFLAVFETRRKRGWLAGALLGASMLAKGLVPVVLFAPAFLIARGKRLSMIAGCIVVAAPWYALCLARNGAAFWDDFFWKQHVERFYSPSLQHVQPLWYYLPVILAGLFPWTPLAALLLRRKTYQEVSVRFLAAWFVFGLVFFSVAQNKLPGYALPLMPALAVILAVALETAPGPQWWLAACALMLIALPPAAAMLPDALLAGIRAAHFVFQPALPFVVVAAAAWWLGWRQKPALAILTIVAGIFFGVVYVKRTSFRQLEQRVSVRGFWRANASRPDQALSRACVNNIRRDWQYGLNYYAGRALPECGSAPGPRIVQVKNDLSLSVE